MKKILPLMLLLFFLVGCSNASNSSKLNEDDIMEDVYITEIEWCGIEWDQIQSPIDLSEDVLKEINQLRRTRLQQRSLRA